MNDAGRPQPDAETPERQHAETRGRGDAERRQRRDLQPTPPSLGSARVGLVGRLLIALVRLYQLTLSRYLGGQCRFVPTCSQYFIDAVRRRGAIRGAAMGTWRILRCNPFCKGGYDPAE